MFGVQLAASMPSQGMFAAAFNFAQNIETATHSTTAKFLSPWFKSGETNRYTKSRESRVEREPPKITKPAGLDVLEIEPYIYNSLGLAIRHIRLLKILPLRDISPKLGTDCIQCELISKGLESHDVEYVALSYTWGPPVFEFPIVMLDKDRDPVKSSVSSKKWKVRALLATGHLYAALVRLRHSTEDRFVWVDQLCINQQDLTEKSQQITFMADIYRNANMTIIWLGEGDEDLKSIAALDRAFQDAPENTQEDDLVLARQDIVDTDSKSGHTRHQAIINLLNRTWFSRAWIYQEATVSPHATFLYGSLSIPLSRLQRLVGSICANEISSGGYARSMIMTTTGYDTLFLITHGRGCADKTCKRDALMRNNFLGLLMQALQQFKATDARDLIYAFLAFDPVSSPTKIVPDYSKPIWHVWIDAAEKIIRSTGSLDIFAAVGGSDPQYSSHLPSWVPTWSIPFPYSRPISAPDFASSFNSHRNTSHVWISPPSAHPEALIVKGFQIDKIAHFTPLNFATAYYRDGSSGTATVLNLQLHVDAINQYLRFQPVEFSAGFRGRYPEGKLKQAVLRTMLADGAFGHEQPLPYEIEQILNVLEAEEAIQQRIDGARGLVEEEGEGERTENEKMEEKILERVREWSLIVQEKKVFISEKGRLGLVCKGADVEDAICVVFGSKVPVVLRWVKGGGGDDGDNNDLAQKKFQAVGQCYLDQWMYGDAPEGEVWGKSGEKIFCVV